MFKVIEDPDQLVALGEAGLLWYYWRSLENWQPSINRPDSWQGRSAADLASMCTRKVYAILLED